MWKKRQKSPKLGDLHLNILKETLQALILESNAPFKICSYFFSVRDHLRGSKYTQDK